MHPGLDAVVTIDLLGSGTPSCQQQERLRGGLCDSIGGRYEMEIRGRILLDGSSEQTCVLSLVEGTTARLVIDGAVGLRASGHAVAYIDLIGRIEGDYRAVDRRTVALDLVASERMHKRLTSQFRLLAQTPRTSLRELRANHRITPTDPAVVLLQADGTATMAAILDFSRSGAALATAARVCVDDRVTVGRTRARVVRTFDTGCAVQFLRLLPWERFDADFRL